VEQPFLSIIIPAHNEEDRLPDTLRQVVEFLSRQHYSAEVLIVENGSHDHTLEIAQAFASAHPGFIALQENQPGKGRAVRRGMLAARGQYRFMCDADLSMPITEVNRFLPPALNDFDIAIASREAPGAVRYNEPEYRHLGGRAINLLIRTLALPGMHDTQCGFKGFRADIAEDLFRYQSIEGWAFDVEILFIARKHGYEIVELPIPWYYNEESKINVLRDSLRMFLDLLKIRKNARQGLYDAQKV